MSRLKIKLPQEHLKVHQLPTELEKLYDGIEDIQRGARFIQIIRKGEYYAEFGGPKNDYIAYYWTEVEEDPNEITDGRVEVIGPEINEIALESSIPFGFHIRICGPGLTDVHVEYLERMAMVGTWEQEGLSGVGARGMIWMRVSKQHVNKHTWAKIAQATRAHLMTTCPLVEAIEVQIIVGAPEVGGKELVNQVREEANKYWNALEAKYRTLDDMDVDRFYGCTICQTFAPTHVCTITPTTIPYCGIFSYHGAKAAYELDPTGYTFECDPGEVLDPVMGHFAGVDKVVWEKSHNAIKKVNLRSCLKYPPTNCGCFEAIGFYIPELDGIGIVHRRYTGGTPLDANFAKLASFITGGGQNHGFIGLSVRGLGVSNLLSGDGGWDRIVWMPEDLKKEAADYIPEEVYDKIITEKDSLNPQEIKELLRQKKHPIVEKFWKNGEPQPLEVPLPGHDWPDEA